MTFDQAYQAYHKQVAKTALRMCMRSRIILDPDDVAQQAWLNIWQGWLTHNPAQIKAWIMTLTRNTFFRMIRDIRGRTHPIFTEWTPDNDTRTSNPRQEWAIILDQTVASFSALPPHEKSAMQTLANGGDMLDIARQQGTNQRGAALIVKSARQHAKELEYE